jgi:putative sigma-54 modulation protein
MRKMNITYTGKKEDFSAEQQRKLDARFLRIGKLVERKGEKKAHVVLKSTRNQHKAEITLNLHDHPMVGISDGPDAYHALLEATEKLEKQIHKLMEKRVSAAQRSPLAKRVKENGTIAFAVATEEEAQAVKIFRVKPSKQKPMTVEEALLGMNDKKDYVLFRDTDTDAVSILVRRADGNFDLLQA